MEATLVLKPGKQEIIKRGHPWVFSGAIQSAGPTCRPGDVVLLCDHQHNPLARGFYNPNSDIAFRVLCWNPRVKVDEAFWRAALHRAVRLREQVVPPATNAFRLINAEGDHLPGLIVDQYGDILVLTISVLGMEQLRPLLLQWLQEQLKPQAIYERSESKGRTREGLPDRCEWVGGHGAERIIINENNVSFQVDPAGGQKTGFFLDQRDNRRLLGSLCKGLDVLNCFSYSGGFSVYAALGNALSVTSVEISAPANELAAANLRLNQLDTERHPLITADVFEYLRRTDRQYDVIVLDPPAFAKSQKEVMRAARGYKDINLQAVKRLKPDGLLLTFSCSNHVDEPLFQKIVLSAIQDAGRSAQVLKVLGPGPDHPVLLPHPEGRYLKGLLLRIG
ncbi:MAG TPA: class I SAM-dependent rRNA methyltransferase [bacterium]|nr:class I SAM-dependent rRNA methyltransferase [bacterium]